MGERGNNSKRKRSVALDLSGVQARIEEVYMPEGGAKIRFSCQSPEPVHAQSLMLSEDELVVLLQKALRAGILSAEFIKNLSAEFEI